MNEIRAGDLGEILLDVLRHSDRSRCRGKILLLDLENPVDVSSQPIDSLRLQKTKGGNLVLAKGIEKMFRFHAPPMLRLPSGEEPKGSQKKPRTYSFGALSDT